MARPSKAFESLYSRVSGQQSLVSSVSFDDCFSTMSPSLSSSLSSSAGICTSSIPAWSPQTSEPVSASSAGQGPYHFDTMDHGSSSVLFSPVISFSPQQLSPRTSLTYDPRFQAHTHNVSIDDAISFPFSSDGYEQSYSDSFSSQVVDHSLDLYNMAMAPSITGFGHQQQKTHLAATREQRWRSWLDAEAYRRLLTVCFALDHHAAIYHQQPLAKNDIDLSSIPLTGPTDKLWGAASMDEWYAILEADPSAAIPKYLPRLDTLRHEDISGYSVLDQSIILLAHFVSLENQKRAHSPANRHADDYASTAEELRTPTTASYTAELLKVDEYERVANLFSGSMVAPVAHVYVALQHTPLHDLLAVSGETWVFSQKVLVAPTFFEHQKRLKAWAEGRSSSTSPTSTNIRPISPTTTGLEGLSSAKATIYAARALVTLLEPLQFQGRRPYMACISTYWAIYVCALIIWAYGHNRAVGGSSSSSSNKATSSSNGTGSSASAASSSSSSSSGGSPNKGTPMSPEETIEWLRMVAAVGQPEHLARVRGRREASAGVVSMVKGILEEDCVGSRSRLYVDATVVLRKLEEGFNGRLF